MLTLDRGWNIDPREAVCSGHGTLLRCSNRLAPDGGRRWVARCDAAAPRGRMGCDLRCGRGAVDRRVGGSSLGWPRPSGSRPCGRAEVALGRDRCMHQRHVRVADGLGHRPRGGPREQLPLWASHGVRLCSGGVRLGVARADPDGALEIARPRLPNSQSCADPVGSPSSANRSRRSLKRDDL